MKRIIYGLLIITLISCEKKIVSPKLTTPPKVAYDSLNLNGLFILVSGKMYIDNIENGDKLVYNHFDSIKSRSSLSFYGPTIPLENLIKDTTTWSFYFPSVVPNIGRFVLNMDTLHPMGLNVTRRNLTIIESPDAMISGTQLNGSARPIQIILFDVKKKLIKIYIQEQYFNLNGYNYKSFNELIFKQIKKW
jgi:hypothetical protein